MNGPPGTGITTLFQDVFAELIVRRARVLSCLGQAGEAFQLGSIPVRFSGDSNPTWVVKLKPELTGFEMVVASSNNPAIENISRDLPKAGKSLGASWSSASYLQSVAHKVAAQLDDGSFAKLQAHDVPWGSSHAHSANQRIGGPLKSASLSMKFPAMQSRLGTARFGLRCSRETLRRPDLSSSLHEAWLADVAPARKQRVRIEAVTKLLSNKRPDDRSHVLAIWQSLFLIVPVVSTTFASFANQFCDLQTASLGWAGGPAGGRRSAMESAARNGSRRPTPDIACFCTAQPLYIRSCRTVPAYGGRRLFTASNLGPKAR